MNKVNAKFFLAANSAEGFVSFFDCCYDPAFGWNAYIIKGGPGTGKSSFMKKILKRAAETGIASEEIYCASDPDSLDGVILPTIKTVFLDGTSPHVVEPRCPGVCETLLDFGKYWNRGKLFENGEAIYKLSILNKSLHKKAGELVAALGEIIEEELCVKTFQTGKIEEISEAIAEKYFVSKGGSGRMWFRFSSGVTPRGLLTITEPEAFGQSVLIDGSVGFVSKVLENLKNKAENCGYERIILKDPILPSRLLDGIVIPELSLFIGRNPKKALPEKAEGIIEGIADILKTAKENHDELEKYYIEAMDFEELNRFTDKIINKILAL